MKLKDFVNFNPKETLIKNHIYRKISMDQLSPFTRNVHSINFEKYSGGTKFKNEDTIFARITPCLENGKTSFISCLDENEIAFGSTEFIVVRSKKDISLPLFAFYLMNSSNIRNRAIISMTGSSGRERVQQIALDNIDIPNYSIAYQQHIVNTIGSVDDLIENYQEQIDKICKILEKSLLLYPNKTTFSNYYPKIIKSGIKKFDDNKFYIDTSSINEVNNILKSEKILFTKRPSRANMQPLKNSVWFAKMKGSNKNLIITENDEDIIKNDILSTGFFGVEATKDFPLSLLVSIIISKDFQIQRDLNSVGTTMAGINNNTFEKILVPLLNTQEIINYDIKYKSFIKQLSLLRQKINCLLNLKNLLLKKYF